MLQGVDEVVNADDKDENEVTGRLGRIPGSPAPLSLVICGAPCAAQAPLPPEKMMADIRHDARICAQRSSGGHAH